MQQTASMKERWDRFLIRIKERFQELMDQTETLLPQVVELKEFDTTPIQVAWQGIRSQVLQLQHRIEETWREQGEQMNKEPWEQKNKEQGILNDEGEEAYKKARDLISYMERELRVCEIRTFAAVARKVMEKAREELSRLFRCTQCQAPLPVQAQFFRSYYQTCNYCQSVNTFEPGSIARNVEHFVVHALAEEKAMNEYFDYWEVEEQYKQQRSDESAVVTNEQLLSAYTRFAEVYLQARISVIPGYQNHYDRDLQAMLDRLKRWTLHP